MPIHPCRVLSLLLTLTLITLSCGDPIIDDHDLRIVQQADTLRAKLGESVKSSFTIVNPSPDTMQFTIESHAPENLLTTAITRGSIAPKSAQEIVVTATCPMTDGQFLMKITVTNDDPESKPVDAFLRLQCGWVAADPETIGNLLVVINGLPDGLDASILIEGPEEFEAIIDTTTTLRGLPLGRYVLTAGPLFFDNQTYEPAPLVFIIGLTNDNKSRATFNYAIERDFDDNDG